MFRLFYIIAIVLSMTAPGVSFAKGKSKGKSKSMRARKLMPAKKKSRSRPKSRSRSRSRSNSGGGAAGRLGGGQRPMQVKGQTRNLSMMLVLKNKKDRINFVKVRKNYNKEIIGTDY